MVYVDDGYKNFKLGRMRMSHMVADTVDELVEMAIAIGLKIAWMQRGDDHRKPHFDVALDKRRMAIRFGAHEVTMREMVSIRKRGRHEK